jgi:hypothetical protein
VAYEYLVLFCERDMPDSLERTFIKSAYKKGDSSRLQALVAKYEKAIQTYDARLAAATAASAAHLAAIWPQDSLQHISEWNSDHTATVASDNAGVAACQAGSAWGESRLRRLEPLGGA